MTRSAWLLTAVIALAAAAGGWLYFNFERVPERELVGYQGEAARNPLLALTRLLERMGSSVRPMARITDLDSLDPGTTLIIARGRRGITRQRAERLLAWARAGGHLIVEAERPRDRDVLLDALQVTRRDSSAKPGKTPAEIELPHVDKRMRVQIDTSIELADREKRARNTKADGVATPVLHFALQRGRGTVLPSFAFMRNDSIGQHDHATFAWALVQFMPSTSSVVIAPRFERPSLIAWLAREARAPLFAGAALLALWLWRVSVRFGPLEPERMRERRRLLDHLRASGHFLWSAGAGPRLLAAAREACLQRIARTRPGLADLPPAERRMRFAALTQLEPAEVEEALTADALHAHEFTRAVRALQRIEEKLTRRVGG